MQTAQFGTRIRDMAASCSIYGTRFAPSLVINFAVLPNVCTLQIIKQVSSFLVESQSKTSTDVKDCFYKNVEAVM